jgi:DNA replication ATP-dependent helicase Dna2
VALDRVLMGVMRLGFTDFLRVGDRRNASAEFLHELEAQGNPPVFLDEAWKARNDFTAFRKYAHSVRMIGAVAYQCAAHHVFKRMKFDRVIVDEAGQLDEPSTLGPLARAPRFVLAGDHLQLPPVVRASFASDDVPGLERSLFERLFMETDEDHVARLSMQYRMNQEIQDIPSDLFYGGRLRPSPDAASRRLLLPAGLSADSRYHRILDPELPVVFVDIDGADCGKARPEEAAAVAKTAAFLLGGGAPAHEIGIITPYRAQQALIRRSLDDAGAGSAALSVDTVDRFQGGEREVIILSLARSDGVTSFLADRKRLCVSLSRARSKLILMGHGPALKENELFSAMLARIEHVRL